MKPSPAPRILITRPHAEATKLATLLREHHFEPVILPLFEIQPLELLKKSAAITSALTESEIAIFVSRHAVKQVAKAQKTLLKNFKGTLFAIGESTAAELFAYGVKTVHYPLPPYTSESLLELPLLKNIQDRPLCIFSGVGGRELLAEVLTHRGANVQVLATYERQPLSYDPATLAPLLQGLDCIVSASRESLDYLIRLLPSALQIPLLVVSQNMLESARSMNFKKIRAATDARDFSIVKALNQWLQHSNPHSPFD